MSLQRIKRLTTHAGYGRYLSLIEDTPYVIPSPADIPSPYSFSATRTVYKDKKQYVVILETAHRRYDVFAVPETLLQPRADND